MNLRLGDLADQGAVADHAVAGGHAVELVEHVAGNDNGDAALAIEPDQRLAHVARGLRVHAVEGLVQKQEVGRADQREGQTQALLHAQGELFGGLAARVCKAYQLEQVAAVLFRVDDADGERLHHEVVEGGVGLEDAGLLDERAHVVRLGRVYAAGVAACGTSPDWPAVKLDLAPGGGGKPGDHLHGGGLAGSVVADESVDVAFVDGHVEMVDGVLLAVDLCEVVRLDGVHGCS